MHPRLPVPDALRWLADLQDGVVTREQALGLGVSPPVLRWLLRDDVWRPVARGVYRTAAVPPDWPALAWAGVLLGGDRARLGAQASAHLHGLDAVAPLPVDVLVPPTGPYRIRGPWHFVREAPGARSDRSVGSPPRLGVEDTVLDLCASADEGAVVGLVTTAVQSRRTRTDRLAAVLATRARHPHRRLLTALLADVAAGAESPLELSYLRDVERAHDLPRGRRQASRLGLPYATDVGYDAYALLVELDGRLGHEGTGRFRDLERDNRFVLGGLITLRYGWFDVVHRPCLVAVQVGQVLRAQGWRGTPTRCRRCAGLPDDVAWSA